MSSLCRSLGAVLDVLGFSCSFPAGLRSWKKRPPLQSWCAIICREEVPGLQFMAETLLSVSLCSTGALCWRGERLPGCSQRGFPDGRQTKEQKYVGSVKGQRKEGAGERERLSR